ncbi:MAG: glycoside hydrolase family 32 protein, partial [Tannerellaceae bacterium]|nr:glycoside hydrolase family 32 protein [Tannerellaceae bacterium]MCD8263152.1 glycoside hydrolase family 32 protein [Tannerellaceae bacterium]
IHMMFNKSTDIMRIIILYYDGEYHLYYQHNPYERDWGNMHWGHAVSKDLIHWEELPVALFPDHNGTAFSGSAVIDYTNTSGWGHPNNPAMIAIYTADSPAKQVQCVAYSLDKGRTYTKYADNPVIDSKAKWNSQDTRDPKVFWYKPNSEWVMVLNERDGHSIYTSANLKDWTFESHITGFWECPELFELPVNGNPDNTLWVMYGASGTYMLGNFNGKVFTPVSGKYYYTTGGIYAAQTITNMPESDGRRIQIGWGRLPTPGEKPAFNNLMTIPTELTLRKTKDGVRLFSEPVREFDRLTDKTYEWKNLTIAEADEKMQQFVNPDRLRIKTTLSLSHALSAGLRLNGQNLLDYDTNFTLINGVFYSPEDPTSMEITADIIIDRTAIEVFIDGGAYSFSMPRDFHPEKKNGFHFWGNNIEVKDLQVSTLKSIWE